MTTLRVASYNLLHGMHLARGGVIDLPAVAAVLAEVDADVVALQEVDRGQPRSGGTDQVARLAELLGVHGVFGPALLGSPDTSWVPVTHDTGGAAYGVGLLTRMPLTATRRVVLPGGGAGSRRPDASLRNPGWDREPRVALVARVAAPWPLEIIATHLSYLPWRAAHQLQVALRAAQGPRALLLGDLNLPAVAVRALAGWRHAGGAPTYPAWRPRLQMHHLLVRGAISVGPVTVHTTSTSDHLPLVAQVRPSGADASPRPDHPPAPR